MALSNQQCTLNIEVREQLTSMLPPNCDKFKMRSTSRIFSFRLKNDKIIQIAARNGHNEEGKH